MSTAPEGRAGAAVTRRGLLRLWAVFVGVIAGAAVVIPLVAPTREAAVPAVLPVTLALTTGLAALAAIVALDRTLRATPPADDDAAAAELRTRLVLQAAVAEAPVLLAVALAFVVGPVWSVPAAAVPALTGLVLVRPSAARLLRFDRSWTAAGADVSLVRAIPDA